MAAERRTILQGLAGLLLVGLATPASAAIRFSDATETSGVEFRHAYGAEDLTNLVQTTGPGVILFDADADGDLDLYFVNGAPFEKVTGPQQLRNALYLNDGTGHFEDGTEAAGVGDPGSGMGAVALDYDNDGDEDLYVCNFGANVLYRNEGDGTFTDVSTSAGVACELWSAAAAVADVNGDGHLDIFVSNYLDFDPASQPRRSMLSYKEGYRFFPGPYDFSGVSNTLYVSNGDGTFRDASAESGIERVGKGMGCSFSDLDLDGDMDLVVANDRAANQLFINDGTGHFVEMAMPAAIAFDQNGFETGAMGVTTGDLDNDGRPDLLITNMIFEYNTYYRNNGDLTFEDVTESVALHEGSYQTVGWGVNLEDFDRDGDLDVFVSNGHVQDYIDTFSESIQYAQPNLLFTNDGEGHFVVIDPEDAPALDALQVSRGSAAGDLDGDHLVDLVVANSNDVPQILRNESSSPGNWVVVRLQGVRSNRAAIGAKVRVTSDGTTRMREVLAGNGYASQSDRFSVIGLGASQAIEKIEIEWPAGGTDVYVDLPVNEVFLSVEGAGLRRAGDENITWTPGGAP